MKIYNHIFFLAIMAVGFTACSDYKYDNERPKDFSFKLIRETESYNSKTGMYTMKYISKDSSVKADLTETELIRVYDAFKIYDFMRFPDEFICSKFGTFTSPAFSTTIEITYKGENKTVTNTDFCSRKVKQRKSRNFDNLSSMLWDMIRNKSQIKNMKTSNLVFL